MSDDITALRYYVARLEEDLVNADLEAERLRKHNSKLVLDIATLGQEVGRLRGALERIANTAEDAAVWWLQDLARAALAEKEEK